MDESSSAAVDGEDEEDDDNPIAWWRNPNLPRNSFVCRLEPRKGKMESEKCYPGKSWGNPHPLPSRWRLRLDGSRSSGHCSPGYFTILLCLDQMNLINIVQLLKLDSIWLMYNKFYRKWSAKTTWTSLITIWSVFGSSL